MQWPQNLRDVWKRKKNNIVKYLTQVFVDCKTNTAYKEKWASTRKQAKTILLEVRNPWLNTHMLAEPLIS